MNPTSYRLGNLLRETNTGKIVQVIGLKIYDTENTEIEVSGDFKGAWSLEEIPLTEEIFIKLGFEKFIEGFLFWFEKEFFEIIFVTSDNEHLPNFIFSLGVGLQNEDPYYFNDSKTTVSQLQNLYFSLTGEELDISALNPEPIPAP